MKQMDLLYRKYVHPIQCTNNVEGCGFMLGNYFITSGHVIKEAENPYLYISGERLVLERPFFFDANVHDMSGYDLAVFYMPILHSTLELYEGPIKIGMNLKSISFKEEAMGYIQLQCDAIVNETDEGNYFGFITSKNLKAGCSGSPLLLGDKVAGVMTRGNNDGYDKPCSPDRPVNFCFCLSADAIRKKCHE